MPEVTGCRGSSLQDSCHIMSYTWDGHLAFADREGPFSFMTRSMQHIDATAYNTLIQVSLELHTVGT